MSWGYVGAAAVTAYGSYKSSKGTSSSNKLTAEAANYLEKQGKTADEIKEIAANIGSYEDVFKGYAGEIYDYTETYQQYGDQYGEFGERIGEFGGEFAGYGEQFGEYEDEYQERAGEFDEYAAGFTGQAEDMWSRYTEEFIPIQDQAIAEVAQGPDIAGEKAIASADVEQSFSKQRDMLERDQQRYGIDPSSGRTQAMQGDMAREQAIAEVGARNKAARDEEDRHWSKLLSVNAMGASLPGQSAQFAGMGVDASGRAVGVLGEGREAVVQQAGMTEAGISAVGAEAGMVGQQVDMTGKELATVGAAMGAEETAMGASQKELAALYDAGVQYGNVATGYGAQAQTAAQSASAQAESTGQVAAALGEAWNTYQGREAVPESSTPDHYGRD